MAAPDLTSQKLLATNPDQGFGDSVVLPYRPRGFDYTPYQFMGANEDRAAKERAAKADRDLKMLADFGKISNDTKGNPELQYKQGEYKKYFAGKLDRGENIPKEELAAAQADLDLHSAISKDEKNKYDNEISTVIPAYAQTYGDAYNKGLAAHAAAKGEGGYWTTPQGGFRAQSDPTEATHLYDAETAVKDFAGNFKMSSQTNENSWENPEKAGSKKTTAGALFMVSDPKNPGQMKIGVGQQHVDALLSEKNGVLQKKIDKEMVFPQFQKDAEEIARLSKTDKNYAKYALMTPEQIAQDLITNGNPLRKGQGGTSLNAAGYRNQIAKEMLEVHNQKTQGLVESNEEKSAVDSSTGGNASTNVIATPGEYSHTTTTAAPTYYTDPVTGKVTRTTYKINPGPVPGVYFSVKKGENGPATPGLPPLTTNVKNLRNLTTGQILQKTTTDPTFQITHAGFGLIDPQGKKIGGPIDVTTARLNELANKWKEYYANGMKGTKPDSFGNYTGQDIATGFVNEKVNVENDEAAKKKAEETGGEYLYSEDESGKKIATIRYAVQTPFSQQDAIGSHVRANTNYYNRTKLSPEEQALRDAWDKYDKALHGY
jgi:hypothetical protein